MLTVSKFYKNLVKWALTEMLCNVAGTTTLDREWRFFCAELLCHNVIALECGEQRINVSDWLMFIHSYYTTQIHAHIIISKGIFSIVPGNYRVHVSPQRRVVGWLYSDTECDGNVCNVSCVNLRLQITWGHVQNVVSLKVLYKFDT